jgi:hypothetical protein
MAQFKSFVGLRTYEPILRRDLEELERWVREADGRLGSLTAGESIATSQNNQGISSLQMHAQSHASPVHIASGATATDPLTVYPFTWTEPHNFTPRLSTDIPVTITQTGEQLRVRYDASNYYNVSVESDGLAVFDSVGTDPGFKFVVDAAADDGAPEKRWFVFEDSTERINIQHNASQEWILKDLTSPTGNEAGTLAVTTPGGQVGITFQETDGSEFTTFYHLAGGGHAWNSHTTSSASPPERMRLDGTNGHLGVGTRALAKARLHVSTSDTTAGTAPDGNADIAMFEATGGNVGITIKGADSTLGSLHFYDASGAAGRFFYDHADDAFGFATGVSGQPTSSVNRWYMKADGAQFKFNDDGANSANPDGATAFNIVTGSSVPGFATPDAAADTLVVDDSAADGGLTIRTTGTGNIYFGDVASSTVGKLAFTHTGDANTFTFSNRVITSLSSVGTADTTGDNLVIEEAGAAGMSILSATGSTGKLYFGDGGSSTIGALTYWHANDAFLFTLNDQEHGEWNTTGLHVNDLDSATAFAAARLHSTDKTGNPQLRLGYDASEYCDFTVDINGDMTIECTGSNALALDSLKLGNDTTTSTCLLELELPDNQAVHSGTDTHVCNSDQEFNALSFISRTKDDPDSPGFLFPVPKYGFVFEQKYSSSGGGGPTLGMMAWRDSSATVQAVMSEGGVLFHDTSQSAGESSGSAYIWADVDMTTGNEWATTGGFSGTFVYATGSTCRFKDGSVLELEEVTSSPPSTPGGNVVQLYADSADATAPSIAGATEDRLFIINSSGTGGMLALIDSGGVTHSVNNDSAVNSEFQFRGTGTITPNQLGSNIRLYSNHTSSAGYLYVNTSDQLVFDSNAQASEGDTGQAYVDLTDGSASFSNIPTFFAQASAPSVPTSGVSFWRDTDTPNRFYVAMQKTDTSWAWIQIAKAS